MSASEEKIHISVFFALFVSQKKRSNQPENPDYQKSHISVCFSKTSLFSTDEARRALFRFDPSSGFTEIISFPWCSHPSLLGRKQDAKQRGSVQEEIFSMGSISFLITLLRDKISAPRRRKRKKDRAKSSRVSCKGLPKTSPKHEKETAFL